MPLHLSLADGHFSIGFSRAVETYSVGNIGPAGCGDIRSEFESRARRLRVDTAGCGFEIVRIELNPEWASRVQVELRGGQVDLMPSVRRELSALVAQVRFGDILGLADTRRWRLVGARASMQRPEGTVDLQVRIGTGQLTVFPEQP